MDVLVERARHGDADAFARLFERGKLAFWRSIRAVVGNDHDAADVLQETALRAWKALPQFNGESAFETWAMRIALNASYDALRQRNREQVYDFGALAAGNADAGAVLRNAAESLTSQWEPSSNAMLDVQRTLGRLSSADRLVLTLFYVNDLPCAQISEILGVSQGAVRTRLARARERFREEYEGMVPSSPRTGGCGSSSACESAQSSGAKRRANEVDVTGAEARGLA